MSIASETDQIDLSILIRTLNEADRIEATIRSVLPLDAEIVVIDAGSTDDTVKIAQSLGAKVFHNAWPGFGPQRRYGELKCTRRHIFSLDADEIVTPELVDQIREVLSRKEPPKLIIVRKAIVFPNRSKPLPFGFAHEQILIYDKHVAFTGSNPNWDKLEISTTERPVTLSAPLTHFSLRDWNHAVRKLNYVAQLAADTQKPKSLVELKFRLIFEFPSTFLKFYLLRRYFMGGFDGFIMATTSAFGRWLRIVMMYENRVYRRKHEGFD
ncbi:MAG: glycosyltransferase family 2 protein [Hyphomicrobiales bacterium]